VEVHVKLEGIPVGVKEQGGILEHGFRSISVMCLPTSVPEAIVLDVSELGIRDSLRVKDVVEKYPEIDFLAGLETTLANVMPPVIEQVVEEEGEEAAEAATEPEVVGEEKKEEDSEK
jgi:large subunit ribosomal protein L25